MDSELIIERIKSNKNKDKASLMGYNYTLNRVSDILSFRYVKNVVHAKLEFIRGMIL